jgi:DnaJ-class molecular chaperone
MPKMRDKDQYGDLLATVTIQIPSNLTAEEKRLYEELAGIAQKQ